MIKLECEEIKYKEEKVLRKRPEEFLEVYSVNWDEHKINSFPEIVNDKLLEETKDSVKSLHKESLNDNDDLLKESSLIYSTEKSINQNGSWSFK